MQELLEPASFRADDDPCLVAAALACSACLSGSVDWSLEVDYWDGQVDCRCLDCGHERTVSLTLDQALRLALHGDRRLGSN